ncbi:DNA gyrase inhibitor YacG [Crenobacter intestini]|uniref:DNA gyrase inhibitor YacG n=1 Tax=Crenobacter intestini TaxID=2563443 RepID=A0A4T0UKJ7_9NEIS|nr:DNA gyrase inhibitor YacG [Crenobacter intestini]TIC79078.1 DNA gyrase inhibitor YacG [Crenobacter intestini]
MSEKPETVRVVACPQCGAPVRWEAASRYRPFCSERCRLIDLGQWADESYRVPASPPDGEDAPQ